jgi:glutaredoxin
VLLCLAATAPVTGSHAQAAQAGRADVYVFWTRGCPHCGRALEYLDSLAAQHKALRLHRLELTESRLHRRALAEIARRHGISEPRVPFIVVGADVFIGFLDEVASGEPLRRAILRCIESSCLDEVGPLLRGSNRPAQPGAPAADREALPETIRLPLLGPVATRDLSLPVLTVVLAAADGFNPCAMWTLVFLLGLLVGMTDRLRRWTLGIGFVVASALVYYLIMAAWLNILLFLGLIVWVRVAIGLVAIAAGAWALHEFAANPQGVCRVSASPHRRRVLDGLRALAANPSFTVALAGIVLLAFAVNVVELLCSAGIPAVYTQVLSLTGLPAWQYHVYLALYILVFMLDDLLVLGGALFALDKTVLTGAYSHWAGLVGGIVLLGIGAILIVRPQWLMFG